MNENVQEILNYRVFDLRKEGGLSQHQLAKVVGVNRKIIQLIECDPSYNPGIHAIKSLADYFDVSIDYLIGRSDRRNGFFNVNWW